MTDKAVSDAIAALAKSQLLVVDVLRQTQSTTQVMAERLGQICDQNAEILHRLDGFNTRQNDSERNIRVLRLELADVQKRLTPIEASFHSAQPTSRSR